MSKKNKNYIGIVPLFFLSVILVLFALSFLPKRIGSIILKPVDMLSSLRNSEETDRDIFTDSLLAQIDFQEIQPETDTTKIISPTDSLDALRLQAYHDSLALITRDSLYKEMITAYSHTDTTAQNTDSSFIAIEDFSTGKKGLEYFFSQLRNIAQLNRPIYIAFLGDSFIEGDIFVADFRNEMQKRYGGKGVGFVPVTSEVNQYRPTVKHKFSGWKTYSILHSKKHRFTLPGIIAIPKDGASLSYANSNRYSTLNPVSEFKLFYQNADSANIEFIFNKNNQADTIATSIPNSQSINEFIYSGEILSADIKIIEAKKLEVVGVSFEENKGVIVDNFSLRGNSGLILSEFDGGTCDNFNKMRPYDLIIIQYGLNVASGNVLNYNWYTEKMKKIIRSLRDKFPQSDFLIMGVSDRGQQNSSNFGTMPEVVALLTAQKKLAKEIEIPFWNTFLAMGGKNSMVNFVSKGWAAKDYTHLTFSGGKELAKAFMRALEKEKEFYDQATKINY